MIDQRTFKLEWGALCERFNRKPSQIETKRYYDYCSAHLDTEGFVRAAHRIYAEHTFWPRPVDFVGQVSADTEWEKVERLLSNFSSPLTSLSPTAQRAVRAMGGLARIGAREADLHFRRKEFTELYGNLEASPENLLPPGDVVRKLTAI